jgi:hypothetical protein
MAAEFLATMGVNRKLSKFIVQKYLNDMLSGKWIENSGESIKFNRQGNLIDGMHRLNAIVLFGKGVKMLVAYNVDDKAFEVIDTGKVRNSNDVFNILQIQYAAIITSAIKRYTALKEGRKSGTSANYRILTNQEVVEIYYKDQYRYDKVAKYIYALYENIGRIMEPALLSSMYLYLSDVDETATEEFFNQIENPTSTGVVQKLKLHFAREKYSNKKMNKMLKNALFIKAWNYFRKGMIPLKLKHSFDDNFPKAI